MRRAPLLLAFLAALLVPSTLRAQSAADVLGSALDAWEERMEGVENFTLTHRVMGMETTTYFEREEGESRPVFESRSRVVMNGQTMASGEASDEPWNNPYELFPELAEHARVAGTETLDGARTHLLVVEDFSDFDLGMDPGDDESFQPTVARFWVDPELGVLRRMEVTGTMTEEGRRAEITSLVRMEDYREMEGLFQPGRVVVVTSGLQSAMTPEERAQARQALEQMRAHMEQMSEQQREMMEGMMSDQMERLEQMLSEGSMEVVVELVDVAVNEGPPAGFQE